MYLVWFSLTRHFKTITIRQHHSLLILKDYFLNLEISIGGVKHNSKVKLSDTLL